MPHFHFASVDAILLTRTVLLHLHLVVHLSHAPAFERFVMLDEQWRMCLAAFLRSVHDRSSSEATLINYESTLRRFFAAKHPEDATKNDVESFLHQSFAYQQKDVCPATRNYRLAVITSFYKFAATYMIPGPSGRPMPLFCHSSPVLGIRRAKVPRNVRTFSAGELERFFAAIDRSTLRGKRDYAIFSTLWWTARRAGEIANLLFGDIFPGVVIDPDGSRHDVMLYRWHGKGMPEGAYDMAELPHLAYEAIRVYLEASGRLPDMVDDDPIFTAILPACGGGWPRDPYRPITTDAMLVRLKFYCGVAGLNPKNFVVHSLRHAAARERYSISPDVREVQRILRHENIATTDRYISAIMASADPVARLLEERFGYLL
jgi:integrase